MQLYNFYNLLTGILSAVLALMYLAVLIKVRKGSKFLFVIVISALMFASNIAGILVVFSNYKVIG
jgi:Na+/H+ antiporter NhaD/arsenite permease-like protein